MIQITVKITLPKNTKKLKYHKYDDSFLAIDFTAIELNGDERPQYVMKGLAPDCMLPSKLKRHLETPSTLADLVSILGIKLNQLTHQKSNLVKQTSIRSKAFSILQRGSQTCEMLETA